MIHPVPSDPKSAILRIEDDEGTHELDLKIDRFEYGIPIYHTTDWLGENHLAIERAKQDTVDLASSNPSMSHGEVEELVSEMIQAMTQKYTSDLWHGVEQTLQECFPARPDKSGWPNESSGTSPVLP